MCRFFKIIFGYLAMLSVAHTILCWMPEWLMNDELERMWKEAVVVYFKVLCRNSPGWTAANHENLSGLLVPQSRFKLGTPRIKGQMCYHLRHLAQLLWSESLRENAFSDKNKIVPKVPINCTKVMKLLSYYDSLMTIFIYYFSPPDQTFYYLPLWHYTLMQPRGGSELRTFTPSQTEKYLYFFKQISQSDNLLGKF
jgi:hypothetical protein